jgi:hypothetical protein
VGNMKNKLFLILEQSLLLSEWHRTKGNSAKEETELEITLNFPVFCLEWLRK